MTLKIRPTDEDIAKAKKLNTAIKLVEKAKKKGGRRREFPLYFFFEGEDRGEYASKTIYHFLILNRDKREIDGIKGSLHGRFVGFIKDLEISNEINGKVQDVFYKYLCMNTHNKFIPLVDLKFVYNGKLENDNRLYKRSRKGEVQLQNYIESKIEKIISIE